MAMSTARARIGRGIAGSWLVPGSARVEARQLVGGELDLGGRGRVGDRGGPLGARDRDDDRGLGELPGQRDLLRADATLPGDLGEGGVLVGELLGVGEAAERAPRQEGQAELLAHVDLGPARAELRAELVLHADQRGADLLRVGVGEADVGDLAAVGDLLQRADDLVVGDLRVGPVVLPERDLLHAEALQAGVDGLAEVGGRAVGVPAAALGADVAALGGEHDAVTGPELVEDRGDEPLVLALRAGALLVAGAVGVGGVEEGDARVEGRRDGVEELLAGLAAGLVEGHQAEADGADLVLSEGASLHVTTLVRATKSPGRVAGGRVTPRPSLRGRDGSYRDRHYDARGQAFSPRRARTSSGPPRSGVATKTVDTPRPASRAHRSR